jgi:hypothetical protein
MSFLNTMKSVAKYRSAYHAICLMAIALVVAGFGVKDQSVSDDEYKVKAVFLYNFARFVEWPTGAFPEPESPFVIGVLGDDPFGPFLDETVRDEKVNERPLITNRYQKASDIGMCHILFVSKSVSEKHEDILLSIKGKNILTVSDVSGFTKNGGMIRFVNEDNKIKILINLEAAKSENLVISSKLLRIARIVESQN